MKITMNANKELTESLSEPFSVVLISSLFNIAISGFAVWVVLIQIAFIFGFTFNSVRLIYTIIFVPMVVLISLSYIKELKLACNKYTTKDNFTLLLLLTIVLVSGIVSLGTIRPDLDDVNYTSRVIYHLANPDLPLDLKFHDYWLSQYPMESKLKIFQTWTFFCAYISSSLNIPFLDVYHYWLPVLGGISIPLAWFLAFSRFTGRTVIAALSAIVVCVFLSLNGESHRSFGNFSFVRIWQGKALLMSVLLPFFIYLSMNFYEKVSVDNWKKIFLSLIAATGLTAMSSYFMFFLGIILTFSIWFRFHGSLKDYISKATFFFSAYIYLAAVTLISVLSMNMDRVGYIGTHGWLDFFVGQVVYVFNWPFLAFIVFVLLTLITIIVAEKKDRNFILAWCFVCVIFFLNPLVFPFIAKFATTLNTYWRLFFLLPMPFIVGFVIIAFTNRYKFNDRVVLLFVTCLVGMALGVNVYAPNFSTFGNLPFNFGQYKFSIDKIKDIEDILENIDPGPTLAPTQYSGIIPIYSSKYPQLVVRSINLLSFAYIFNQLDDAESRIRAQKYVSYSTSREGSKDLLYYAENGLKNIIIKSRVAKLESWTEVEKKLVDMGFRRVKKEKRYFVFMKD